MVNYILKVRGIIQEVLGVKVSPEDADSIIERIRSEAWKPADNPPEMLGPGIPSAPVLAEIYEYGKPPHLAVVVFWRSVAPNQPGKWYLSPWFYGLDGPFMEVPVRQWTELPLPPVMKQGELFQGGGVVTQDEEPKL